MKNDYQDIINKPHHTSKTHKRMPKQNRAAQFAPFAALTGYEAAVLEAARLTENKIMLDDSQTTELNEKLNGLKSVIKTKPKIKLTYFVKDDKKQGGSYQEYDGNIRIIDEVANTIIFCDRKVINITDIIKIEFTN